MKGRSITAAVTAASLVGGCLGGGGEVNSAASAPPGTQAIDRAAPETFGYVPAQDRNLRVVVGQVLMRSDRGYLPKDGNWLQMPVTLTNVGSSPLAFGDIRTRLADGLVLASALGAGDLASPPSISGEAAKQVGIGAAGMMAGMFIFPPLALVAGGLNLLGITGGGQEKWARRIRTIDASMLRGQSIAPGTSVSGSVFIPAVKGQSALIAFYSVDGRAESLSVVRDPQ